MQNARKTDYTTKGEMPPDLQIVESLNEIRKELRDLGQVMAWIGTIFFFFLLLFLSIGLYFFGWIVLETLHKYYPT